MNIQIKSKKFHISLGMQSRIHFALKKLGRFQVSIKNAKVYLMTNSKEEQEVQVELETRGGLISIKQEDAMMGKALKKAFLKLENELIQVSHLQGWEEPVENSSLLLH